MGDPEVIKNDARTAQRIQETREWFKDRKEATELAESIICDAIAQGKSGDFLINFRLAVDGFVDQNLHLVHGGVSAHLSQLRSLG